MPLFPDRVFIALPMKDKGDCSVATMEFIKSAMQNLPEQDVHFSYGEKIGENTPAATSKLADMFRRQSTCEWFFLVAGDIVTTVHDVGKLIALAKTRRADIIGGLVIAKPKPELNAPEWMNMLTGDFDDPADDPSFIARTRLGTDVKWFKRGREIKDDYIKKDLGIKCDIVGGGVALFHRAVIEQLAPERNNGLPYFSYDRMEMNYDIRVFQRAKEKGAQTWCHCGVLIGHIGKDKFGNQRSWTYWDLPKIKEEKWTAKQQPQSPMEASTIPAQPITTTK